MFYLSFPSINPVIFSLGPFEIRWYSLAYIVGFLFAWRYIRFLTQKKQIHSLNKKIDFKFVDDLVFYSIVGLILGARLGYVIFYNPSYYLQNPFEIIYLWQGGLSFHGGLLGIVIASLVLSKSNQIDFFQLSDLICVSAPVGIFFGRIANFINGELYGRPSEYFIGMQFPGSDMQYRHPSQLYEAFLEGLVIFIVLNILIHKFDKLKKPGFISSVFLIMYGVFRFFIEFTREPDQQLGLFFEFLSMGMILSIPMIIFGIFIFIYSQSDDRAKN